MTQSPFLYLLLAALFAGAGASERLFVPDLTCIDSDFEPGDGFAVPRECTVEILTASKTVLIAVCKPKGDAAQDDGTFVHRKLGSAYVPAKCFGCLRITARAVLVHIAELVARFGNTCLSCSKKTFECAPLARVRMAASSF